MKQIVFIVSFLASSITFAQTCEDITSLGLGTFNSSSGEVGILAYHAPLEGYRDGMNVELFGPDGEQIWFWETSGERSYYVNNPLIESAGSGTYTLSAAVDDIAVSCEATVDVNDTLGLIKKVEVELLDGEIQATWSPVKGAEEYNIKLLNESANSMSYSVDIRDDEVMGTLRGFEPNGDPVRLQITAFSAPTFYTDVETGEPYTTPGIHKLNGSISELEVTLE